MFSRYNGGTQHFFFFRWNRRKCFQISEAKDDEINPTQKLDNSKQDVMYAHHINSNPIISWPMHYITRITQRVFQSILYYNVIRFIIQACWYVNHLIFRFDLTWSYYYYQQYFESTEWTSRKNATTVLIF